MRGTIAALLCAVAVMVGCGDGDGDKIEEFAQCDVCPYAELAEEFPECFRACCPPGACLPGDVDRCDEECDGCGEGMSCKRNVAAIPTFGRCGPQSQGVECDGVVWTD